MSGVQKSIINAGCVSAALAVIIGAFAAHALRSKISPEALQTFEVGVRYHMYHSLAMIGLAAMAPWLRPTWIRFTALLYVMGIFLFSGSLYLLSTREIWAEPGSWSALGFITPFGGLCFIIAWLLFGFSYSPQSNKKV